MELYIFNKLPRVTSGHPTILCLLFVLIAIIVGDMTILRLTEIHVKIAYIYTVFIYLNYIWNYIYLISYQE